MPKKGIKTKSHYLDWDDFKLLSDNLKENGDNRMCLFINIGCYTGLLISDLLELKWSDVLYKEKLVINKSSYKLTIPIHYDLRCIIVNLYEEQNYSDYLFINKSGKILSPQHINRLIKKIIKDYNVGDIEKNYTTHFTRKTFGHRVWQVNNYSTYALIELTEIFGQDSTKVTTKYLNISGKTLSNKEIYLDL